jgi:hypothetical protein
MDKRKRNDVGRATIEYESLGIISIEHFEQALWEDLKALHDFYGVRFLKGARLEIPVTTEKGDPVPFLHPDGYVVQRLTTHFYQPAYLEFHL